jgi:hypothetical protein
MAMNIQRVEPNEDGNAEYEPILDTAQYGRIPCRFEDFIFAISISSLLFLIASVIAIALYTVT